MIKKIIYTAFCCLILLTAACSRQSSNKGRIEKADDGKVRVFTSILPQKYFVGRIGGDKVDVSVLVLPGKSPATYEPTPSQVVELSSADIFFNIGVPFENGFLEDIRNTLKNIRIKDVSDGIVKRNIKKHFHDEHEEDADHDEHEEDADHDEHEEDADHDEHAGKDPHIWLSLNASKIMAENIYTELSETDPENSDFYRQNYNQLIGELDKTDKEIRKKLAPYKGLRFFVFHPSFGYFADEYSLEQVAVESGGKEPSPASLEKIIAEARAEGIKVIIAQPEFSKKSAEVIADAIDGEVLLLNPLDPDYFNTLRKIADGIIKALE